MLGFLKEGYCRGGGRGRGGLCLGVLVAFAAGFQGAKGFATRVIDWFKIGVVQKR